MNQYSHKGKRNILLWDGMDSGITQEKYKMSCPFCSDESEFSVSNLDSLDTAPTDFKLYLKNERIVSKGEIKKTIPAYIIKHECVSCHKHMWRIIGLKEIQPARYNIYYKSTVFEKIK